MYVEVCSHMGLESSCAENVRDVWADHEAGVDVRAPPNRKRALKLSAGDRAVARDCLKSGFGLGQATLHVEAHRLKKLEKEVEEGLREMNENLEELASISKEWVRVTMQRDDGDVL